MDRRTWRVRSAAAGALAALAALMAGAAVLVGPSASAAQDFTVDDPVLRAIWEEGMERSQVYPLAQVLLDSIGPRLTGTPQLTGAHEWLVGLYDRWGIEAANEQYGMWKGWERGVTHVALTAPRVKTLDGLLVGWSPGFEGAVEAGVVSLPDATDAASVAAWEREARGKFVLATFPEPSCRPVDQWQAFADGATYEAFVARREAAEAEWRERGRALGGSEAEIAVRLARAGVAGVLSSSWSGGYGARRVFGDRSGLVPMLSLSCEDYGLLARLAENGQGPRIRVEARSRELGEVPVFNTVARIPGTERPDEYVLLSAHLDSWDGAQGAADNGTGTVIMAEAMRLLRAAYPNPKRTIVAGHWGSEEQGLNGSRAFAADHPEVVAGLQALFNQDNGTGAIARVSMQGLVDAGPHFVRWLSAVPRELSSRVQVEFPGTPGGGGSDYAAFTCHGAPSFGLWSDSWDYGRYLWHTNLDTLDKLSFDTVRENAVLIAMLAYMASEDPEMVSRERRTVMPVDQRTGEPATWPACGTAMRSWSDFGH